MDINNIINLILIILNKNEILDKKCQRHEPQVQGQRQLHRLLGPQLEGPYVPENHPANEQHQSGGDRR